MEEKKSMEELLDEEFEMWNPQPGEKLLGKKVGKRTGIGKFASTVYIIKKETGELIGVWGSTVTDDKLKDVPDETPIGIKYLGPKEGKTGTYKDFRIIVDQEPEIVQKTLAK